MSSCPSAITLLLALAFLLAGCGKQSSSPAHDVLSSRPPALGDEINNGGGASEPIVLYAFQHLEQWTRLCSESWLCGLTPSEQVLLKRIEQAMPGERPRETSRSAEGATEKPKQSESTPPTNTDSSVHFLAEHEHPGFFFVDGQVRAAKTGDKIGSPIYVNTDLLYRNLGGDQWAALTLPEAIALLTHELGHHHNETDHTRLDLLGQKVRAFLQQEIVTFTFPPYLFGHGYAYRPSKGSIPHYEMPTLVGVDLNPTSETHPDSHLLVTDSYGIHDVSDALRKSLEARRSCPGGRLVGFKLFNFRAGYTSQDDWGELLRRNGTSFPKDEIVCPFQAHAIRICEMKSGEQHTLQSWDITLTLRFAMEGTRLRYLSDERIDKWAILFLSAGVDLKLDNFAADYPDHYFEITSPAPVFPPFTPRGGAGSNPPRRSLYRDPHDPAKIHAILTPGDSASLYQRLQLPEQEEAGHRFKRLVSSNGRRPVVSLDCQRDSSCVITLNRQGDEEDSATLGFGGNIGGGSVFAEIEEPSAAQRFYQALGSAEQEMKGTYCDRQLFETDDFLVNIECTKTETNEGRKFHCAVRLRF